MESDKVQIAVVIPNSKNIFILVENDNDKEKKIRNRTKIVCHRCGQKGHYKSECGTWKTRICWHWACGRCRDIELCSFAHGDQDMRKP